MATDDKQTAVTDADSQAQPGNEVTDAQKAEPNLDELLAEFEQETGGTKAKPSTPEKQSDKSASSPDMSERIEALERGLAEKQLREDLSGTVQKIKAGLPEGVLDDQQIIDLLDGMARRDSRLQNAWLNRHANPKAWERVQASIAKDFSGRFAKLPDKAATEDREAVTAAVRGASTRASEGKAPSYGNLSDGEFASQVEKEHGFRPL